MTTTENTSALAYAHKLRTLYFVRFAFAIVWVGIMFATAAKATDPNALLTVLLIVYPAFDAGAVLWQLRADPDKQRPKVTEWISVAVSIAVAIALGISSSASIATALAVWGAWAIVAGVPQLITAIRNRRSGGQVAQMLSGGISVLAGASFLFQGIQGNGAMAGAAGYAALGAIFFLVSAIRLSVKLRKRSA
ncbi:DUF308 domain-containing protein [Brevibacterium sp. 91QC2O2]|uniref:DUF308 domain-containing protein n=1 Tax=Brevibacterium sp. 91QC2O2 TaxID=2968458 RepID=UPI00211BBAAF|nr:DUF308 domain-containing protein [Brevibacterium sp. 91QC2O2]MCQ9366721.1 DUF308 domain-containing protein [Brevibacterium sp. 91QC2O2]